MPVHLFSRQPERKSFLIYAVLLFIIEVLIARFVSSGFIRGFVGDVLVCLRYRIWSVLGLSGQAGAGR